MQIPHLPPVPGAVDLMTSPVFEPLLKPARYKGAHGGRGSGKSHFFAEMAIELCVQRQPTSVLCAREVQKTLKESVKRLIDNKLRQWKLTDGTFDIRHDRILTPGGGVMIFNGMQDHTAESIKSLEDFDIGYFEEAQTMTQRSLELLRPTIRNPNSELWFSWNPRNASDPVDQFLRPPEGVDMPPRSIVVEANWSDNKFFPAVLEEERQFDLKNNPVRYNHIWEGAYEPAAIGAIWTREIIARNRVDRAPDLTRIIIGVDPAGSSEAGANETGIIAVGLGVDGEGYVLEDASVQGTPAEWAEATVAAYDLHEADLVVAEKNFGGEMVKATLQTERKTLPVEVVTASRGKHIRAEPISSLYKLNRMHHVGAMPTLEDQMCLFTAGGFEGEGSPDRVDALVWAATKLFGKLTRKVDPGRAKPRAQNNRYNPHRRNQRRRA